MDCFLQLTGLLSEGAQQRQLDDVVVRLVAAASEEEKDSRTCH